MSDSDEDIVGGSVPTEMDTSEMLNNSRMFEEVLQRIASDPERMSEMAGQAANRMSPETMAQMRQLYGNAGTQTALNERLKEAMNNKNMKRSQIRKLQKQAKKEMAAANKREGDKMKIVQVTSSRQMKERTIYADDYQKDIYRMLKCMTTDCIDCPSLSVGPLEGREVKVYFDRDAKTKNKRLTRMTGYVINGQAFFVTEDEDLTTADLAAAEKIAVAANRSA